MSHPDRNLLNLKVEVVKAKEENGINQGCVIYKAKVSFIRKICFEISLKEKK